MAKPKSTVQDTLRVLREEWKVVPEIVERWNHFARIKQDLFGVFDILALDTTHRKIMGIQTTIAAHHAAHLKKMMDAPKLPPWLQAGGEAWLISWYPDRERYKLVELYLDGNQVRCEEHDAV